MTDEGLSTSDVAELLSVTTRNVHQLIEDGRLTSRHVERVRGGAPPRGECVEVNAADLARYLGDEGDDGLAGVPAKF